MSQGHAESSDEMLLVRYRRGDRAAFAELVQRYQRKLFNFCLRYLRARDTAQEVTQETFLRVVRQAADFKHEAKFSTWVFSIARNLCIDELRKAKHRNHAPLDADGATKSLAERIGDTRSNVERAAQAGRLRTTLVRAIEALPEEQREVFLLRQFAGLRFAEIAQVTNSSENTVKSRMRYAMERLQKQLKDFEEYARALR